MNPTHPETENSAVPPLRRLADLTSLLSAAVQRGARAAMQGQHVHAVRAGFNVAELARTTDRGDPPIDVTEIHRSEHNSSHIVTAGKAEANVTPTVSALMSSEIPTHWLDKPHPTAPVRADDPMTLPRWPSEDDDQSGIASSTIDLRMLPSESVDQDRQGPPVDTQSFWLRTPWEIPDDSALHVSALSETLMFSLCLAAMRLRAPERIGLEPQNFSLWVHQGFRADDWSMHHAQVTSQHGHRSFLVSRAYSSLGRHFASACLEVIRT